MSFAIQPLPEDLDALRSFAADLQAELARKDIEITVRDAEIHAKTLHIEKLKMQLAVLRRARFGRSSEKLDRDIEQLELLIGELEEEAAEEDARAAAADPAGATEQNGPKHPDRGRPRKQPGRTKLPDHLPREIVTHEPACTCPGCGGKVFSRIGQDEREVLEYIPSSFKVIQHIRPKLSCRVCETIVQAPMPSLPIERGRPGPGLLARVAVSKFCDHLPLHRQSTIYAREGVELDRATLADWMGQVVFLLTPLAEAINRHIRAGAVLHADDTTVPLLAPGLGRTATGRLWVVVRDERPWGRMCHPPRSIATRPTARASTPKRCSAPAGFLHADGYAGFDRLYRPTTRRGRRRWSRWLAGATFAASSTTCITPPPRRLRSRPCSGSRRCSPSRAASTDAHPTAAAPRVRNMRAHRGNQPKRPSKIFAQRDQRQKRAREGDPLRPLTVEGVGPLSGRWPP